MHSEEGDRFCAAANDRGNPLRVRPLERMRKGRLFVLFLLLLLTGAERRSYADASPHFNWINWYVPVGVNLGAAIHPEASEGFLLGAETGAFRVFRKRPILHTGMYLDYTYDFGTKSHRWSLGPEFGIQMFKLDIGVMLRNQQSRLTGEVRFRASLNLFFVSILVGQTVSWVSVGERTYSEVGVTLQVPFCFETHGPCDGGFQPVTRDRQDPAAIPAPAERPSL
jgi:hypothetical protein